MTFAGNGDVANAVKLSPSVGARLICPNIIEPSNTVCATESRVWLARYKRIFGTERTGKACRSTSLPNDLCELAVSGSAEKIGPSYLEGEPPNG